MEYLPFLLKKNTKWKKRKKAKLKKNLVIISFKEA
jgi:hypothetical protein